MISNQILHIYKQVIPNKTHFKQNIFHWISTFSTGHSKQNTQSNKFNTFSTLFQTLFNRFNRFFLTCYSKQNTSFNKFKYSQQVLPNKTIHSTHSQQTIPNTLHSTSLFSIGHSLQNTIQQVQHICNVTPNKKN